MGNLSEHLTVTGLALQCLDDWFSDSDEVDLINAQFGNYQPTTLLSRTMMSYVFLAKRNDGLLEQEVVLKILPKELLLEWQSGFMREWNILARLNHRNIAKIYDAGFNEQGYPYMAMEYVDGLPITDYCNKHRLDVRARVNLIIQVLDALTHAHNNRIVHQDVKPSNILVTPDGSVKLLDFGIAQLVSQAGGIDSSDKRCVFTPSYASPEQLRGDGGVIATDVWQIGLVLYELLVGKNPFKGTLIDGQRQHDCPALLNTFYSFEKTRALRLALKRSMSQNQLKQALKGDIRHVIACCLNPDGTQRYPSADQVKEELQRTLDGFPIRAVTATPTYVLSRFVGRNRYTLTAVVTVLLVVGGFGFARIKEKAQYVKNIEAQKARTERISQFSQKLFGDLSPERLLGEKLEAREILDAGLKRLDSESQALGPDTYMLYITLARYYRLLGDYDKAKGILERLSQPQQFPPIDPFDESYLLLELAIVELHLGKLDLSYHYLITAITNLKAVKQLSSIQGAESYLWLGRLLIEQSKYNESLVASNQSMVIFKEIEPQYPNRMATVKNNLAFCYNRLGDFPQAEKMYRETLILKRSFMSPTDPSIAATLNNLASVLIRRGELDEAQSLTHQAMEISRKVLGEKHPVIASHLKSLALIAMLRQSYEQSQNLYQQALAIRVNKFGQRHHAVADVYIALAEVLVEADTLPQAQAHLTLAQQILSETLPESHLAYFYLYKTTGHLLYKKGELSQAQVQYQKAIELWQQKAPDNLLMIVSVMAAYARSLSDEGQWQQAEHILLSYYEHLNDHQPYGQMDREPVLKGLVELYAKRRHSAQSKPSDEAKQLRYQSELDSLKHLIEARLDKKSDL